MTKSMPLKSGVTLARAAFAAAAAAVAALGVANPAIATESAAVIAESPRATITLADYEAEIAKLTPEARAQFSANRGRLVQLLNNLYVNRAIAKDARAAGLDRDPVVALQLQMLVEKTLAQLWTDRVDRQTAAAFDADPQKYLTRAREIYLTNPDKYRIPERVRASHVLVRIGPDGEDGARTRAESIREKIIAGTPIADIAREASDDPSAKRNAGDLGLFAARDVDPDFAAAAFALTKRGEVSPVVKSRSGFHVIEFHARQPPTLREFDEVRKEILAEIRRSVIEASRTQYQGSMFTDPPVKVNEELIDRINVEARSTATPISGSAKAAR
jgi:peptidyl-prolyl cis-trans isomerase C